VEPDTSVGRRNTGKWVSNNVEQPSHASRLLVVCLTTLLVAQTTQHRMMGRLLN